MKRTKVAFIISIILFANIIITSCKKEVNNSGLQTSVFALENQCDSLSAGLALSNTSALIFRTTVSSFKTTRRNVIIHIDSIETSLTGLMTQISALKGKVTATYNLIAAINVQSGNESAINNQINVQNIQLNQLNQQYGYLTSQLQSAETLIEAVVAPKSYIALATGTNVRNDEGDVIVCPGHYLAAYTRFNRNTSDIGGASIVGKISTDTTGTNWGNEFIISPDIGKLTVMSVSLYRTDQNTINCYFLVKNSTADTRLYLTVSPDNGVTWSAAKQVIHDNSYDIFVNSSIHQVNSGRIVIPVASVPYFSAGYTFSDYCYYSDDNGATWTKSAKITPPVSGGGLEPNIVQLSGDSALMNIRTSTGFQYFSISTDNCATWGPPYPSTLPSPSSPAKIVNISGKLVAVYNNNSGVVRNPLSIAKSADNGATWTHVEDIESGGGGVYGWSYPSVTVSNGYLLISYYETVNEPIGVEFYNLKFTKIQISTLSL